MRSFNWTKIGRRVFRIVRLGCIVHCTTEYVGTVAVCSGISMQPTIYSGDIILGDCLSIAKGKLENGEVIMCKSPEDPFMYLCKRVIAMEGEKVYYNGRYRKIPKGHLWVEGDNKSKSHDSRNFGPISYGLVYTRAVYRIWPPNRIGVLPKNS